VRSRKILRELCGTAIRLSPHTSLFTPHALMKQYAESCERNKSPILEVMREILTEPGLVLEIGSGTGQHAAYFAEHLPHVHWQPTDLAENLASIRAWAADAGLPNLPPPSTLDLFADEWPVTSAQAVVCINTIHIVAWPAVEQLFVGVARTLDAGGIFYVYGPYRYRQRALEPSNEQFDHWLKVRDPASGIREFEAVNELALANGLQLAGDRAMPTNNRSLWWIKST
jgi:SAM-dependent methyltransferase